MKLGPEVERETEAELERRLNSSYKLHVGDLNSINALHSALEKLTGIKNKETEMVARMEFWRSWWFKNAKRIMTDS